jgi:hypothetical protein
LWRVKKLYNYNYGYYIFHKGLGMMAKIDYSYDTTKFFEINMPIAVVIY